MVFLAYFFGYQKHNEQEQIVSTYCPSSQKKKKKKIQQSILGRKHCGQMNSFLKSEGSPVIQRLP